MKKYLIETHCHTDETSNCGKVPAAEAVRLYHSMGYSGMLISDHLHNYTFRTLKKTNPNPTWAEKIEYFLKGYKAALKEAENYPGFKVYLGAELCFDNIDNDFLIFGLSEEILLSLEGVIEMRPEKGLEVIKSKGCAVVQAHPFRDDCVVMKPGICHGIEVFNGHSTESRNDIALEWANKFGFIKTSGSDFHSGTPSGGIISDFLPDNEIELRDLILSGKFDLKTNEEI